MAADYRPRRRSNSLTDGELSCGGWADQKGMAESGALQEFDNGAAWNGRLETGIIENVYTLDRALLES